MKLLSIGPELHEFGTCAEFVAEFKLGKGDLVLTNAPIYDPCFGGLGIEARVVFQEDYGSGEPSDEMAEAIYRDAGRGYGRVVAIGGGTVIDIAKLLALKNPLPVSGLFEGKATIERDKRLVIVPTTCGTGSEATNLSIIEIKARHTKMGLASAALCADHAVLIPELLRGLPYGVFATSSIDALIHAVESSVSPRATAYSRLFGREAIRMIVGGYREIAASGPEARVPLLGNFLVASDFAGIAFGNAGCGAVHAMSYPLGAKFHVAHGEANYALFAGVFESYLEISREGAIADLGELLAGLLGCGPDRAWAELDLLLGRILPRRRLGEYGATGETAAEFADLVARTQGRLMGNGFVALDEARVRRIYEGLL
jgi:4-hydroxybutyrate dehydrogenase